MSRDATPADVIAGRAAWCVVHGDNAEVLPTLGDRSVAHVITDPPYEAAAHFKQAPRPRAGEKFLRAQDGLLAGELSFAPISDAERTAVAAQFARLTDRWLAVFCQVEATMKWQDALVAGGALPRRIGVWIKPDGMPQFSGDRPGMGYESIVFAHRKGRSRWNGGGRVGVFTHNKNDAAGRSGHETQKPLPLMLELVDLFTDPGEVVLDPFAGSGTTGAACIRLGRRSIVGRPVARKIDQRRVVEVNRLCTDGTKNACTFLYAAAARAAAALGFDEIITYTHAAEPGTSLRASGWTETGTSPGRAWTAPSRPRETVASTLGEKVRWGKRLQSPGPEIPDLDAAEDRNLSLFTEVA